MKLEKKGSIGFIIVGTVAVMSSIDSTSDFIIPGKMELLGGLALIVFGLSRLLFQYENKEEKKRNHTAAFFIISLLTIGSVGYFYFLYPEPIKKKFVKTYGTFEVKLNNRTCLGEAILEGEKVTFQIKRIPPDIKIDGLKLYNRNVEIEKNSIEWVCALMSDMNVIRCSTGLDLPKNNFDMFVDNGAYTISYWLKEPLENIKISDISFTILTDKGGSNIKIADRK